MTKTQILFLSASPEEEDQTSFVEVYKRIRRKIKSGTYRDQFELVGEHRLSVGEIQEVLTSDYQPQIVHFFGHGEKGSLLFENEQGEVEEARLKPFVNMFRILNNRTGITEEEKIRLVVLVACDSNKIAKAVSKHVDCAIGMSSRLSENAGIVFTESFYFSLCSDHSVQDAFDLACNQIRYKDLDEHNVPKLVPGENCDPKKMFFVRKAERKPQQHIDKSDKDKVSHGRNLLGFPEDPKIAVERGDWHLNRKDYDKALELYEWAITLNADNDLAWTNKGVTLFKLGRCEEAVYCFDRTIGINPDEVAWANKGAALYSLGRFEEAIECFEEALRINPNYHLALQNLSDLYLVTGNFVKASEKAEKALDLSVEPEEKTISWFHKIAVYLFTGKNERAQKEIELFIDYVKDLEEDLEATTWGFHRLRTCILETLGKENKSKLLSLISFLKGKIGLETLERRMETH